MRPSGSGFWGFHKGWVMRLPWRPGPAVDQERAAEHDGADEGCGAGEQDGTGPEQQQLKENEQEGDGDEGRQGKSRHVGVRRPAEEFARQPRRGLSSGLTWLMPGSRSPLCARTLKRSSLFCFSSRSYPLKGRRLVSPCQIRKKRRGIRVSWRYWKQRRPASRRCAVPARKPVGSLKLSCVSRK